MLLYTIFMHHVVLGKEIREYLMHIVIGHTSIGIQACKYGFLHCQISQQSRQREIIRSAQMPFFSFISIHMYLGIYLESPGLCSLKECERDWNPEAHAPPDIIIPILGRTPRDLLNMNSSRQIGRGHIIYVAYRSAIIKRFERNLAMGLVGTIYCHCTADEMSESDSRNKEWVEIKCGGTCNQKLCWEEVERVVGLIPCCDMALVAADFHGKIFQWQGVLSRCTVDRSL